jgi:hypothetical protein
VNCDGRRAEDCPPYRLRSVVDPTILLFKGGMFVR